MTFPLYGSILESKNLLRSLRHKNYRLFFIGQGISLIGTWMQAVTTGWLVYRLTHSAFLLGMVGFVDKVPIFIFSSLAGVLIDRYQKYRVILVTQVLSMIQAFIYAYLVLSNKIQTWEILVLAAFLGIVNSVDIPARQSFIVEMIEEKENLGNAIALNSTIFNGARLIGPSIGGILVAQVGEGYCFLINAFSFVAVLIALLSMKLNFIEHQPRNTNPWTELKEGVSYAFGFLPTRYILILLSLYGLLAMPYSVLLPAFVKNTLGGGAKTLGFLMAATGAGALLGALYLASRKTIVGLGRWIAVSSSLFAVTLILFSFTTLFWLSLCLMVVVGFGMMVQMASSNTILQTIVDDDKRGRVMSLYVVSVAGMAPFGSLLAGSLANRIGTPLTMRIGGLVCILGSLIFTLKLPEIRQLVYPIYSRMGILKEVSRIQSAVGLATEIEILEKS